MIRMIKSRDLPYLRAMQSDFDWEFGNDFLGGMVEVDENDIPFMAMGAWDRAEVHMVSVKKDTPGMRYRMFRDLHMAMEQFLFRKGIGEAVTWVELHTKCSMWRAFAKRLLSMGWVQSSRVSWHRKVGNNG